MSKGKTFSLNLENGISSIQGKSEQGLIVDGVFKTTSTFDGVNRTLTHTLTAGQLSAITSLQAIVEEIVSDCFEQEKIKRIIYRNDVNAISLTFENNKFLLVKESELPVEFTCKNPQGQPQTYQTAWLMSEFRALCNSLSPNFEQVQWYEPNTLQIDTVILTQKDMTDGCLFLIYLLGELFKQI